MRRLLLATVTAGLVLGVPSTASAAAERLAAGCPRLGGPVAGDSAQSHPSGDNCLSTPASRPAKSSPSSRDPWWDFAIVAVAGLVVGLVIGVGAGFKVARRARRRGRRLGGCLGTGPPLTRGQRPASQHSSSGSAPEPPSAMGADMALVALADAVISVRDLVEPGSALARRIGAALAAGGVVEVAPIGEPFDPALHHAVQVSATDDVNKDGRIADVERVGYRDASRMLRAPEVVVFSASERG